MKKTKIIAEIGVNHNGKISLAKKLIDEAKDSGADYVKFQIYQTKEMAFRNLKKAPYQVKNSLIKKESQYEMLRKYELNFSDHMKIYNYCKKKKIKYLASVFDHKSLAFLEKLKFDYYKIPSSELTNYPLLNLFTKFHKKILLSTGMAEKKDIKNVLNFLIKKGFEKKNITLLHCNSSYPTPLEEVNLKKMNSLKNYFKVNIGYSDHTSGPESAIIAATMGASMIEKHVTLNKKLKGPDHVASIEFTEFKNMNNFLSKLDKILGSGKISISKSEKENILKANKFLVAKDKIKKGDKFSQNNLSSKRTGYGIHAKNFFKIVGKKSKKNYLKDEVIKI